jgi:hypothetical protein
MSIIIIFKIRFIVHWPELKNKYKNVQYIGKLF